jgi:hypothetical protein
VPGTYFGLNWKRGDRLNAGIGGPTEADRIVLSYVHRVGSEDWRRIEYPVSLTWTPCNYGGKRVWFLCPGKGCGQRVAILYSGEIFVCRRCKQLAYPSQRQQPCESVLARLESIRARLGGSRKLGDCLPPKPKGMHRSTYTCLQTRALIATEEAFRLLSKGMVEL